MRPEVQQNTGMEAPPPMRLKGKYIKKQPEITYDPYPAGGASTGGSRRGGCSIGGGDFPLPDEITAILPGLPEGWEVRFDTRIQRCNPDS